MKKKKTMSLFLALALILTTVLALPTATNAEDNKKIERVDVTIKAPICGTYFEPSINEELNAYSAYKVVQNPPLRITFPKDAQYEINTGVVGKKADGVWLTQNEAVMLSLSEGVVKGGVNYILKTQIVPKQGYEFNAKESIFDNAELYLYINGKQVVQTYSWDKNTLNIKVPITAVHDWKAATTTKPKSCKKCGATEGQPLAKKANLLKIKAKTAIVKYSKLKKKNQTLAVGKVISFMKKGQGKMTYAKVSGNKKIIINMKTGKVTVKKKLKKGTYKVKVKVKAAGNSKYKPVTKTVTFKIKVR